VRFSATSPTLPLQKFHYWPLVRDEAFTDQRTTLKKLEPTFKQSNA
jgi:hypothetical protein